MNIYLISQNENTGYDACSLAVVVAENEDQAKKIYPISGVEHIIANSQGNFIYEFSDDYDDGDYDNDHHASQWCKNITAVKVKLIGLSTDSKHKNGDIICHYIS